MHGLSLRSRLGFGRLSDDGGPNESFCRCCGDGGDIVMCDNCRYAFCAPCITLLAGPRGVSTSGASPCFQADCIQGLNKTIKLVFPGLVEFCFWFVLGVSMRMGVTVTAV